MDKEIIWNLVNSALAGALVFLGALTDGGITSKSIIAALVVAGSVAIIQFKNYWQKEESEYCKKTLGTFIY